MSRASSPSIYCIGDFILTMNTKSKPKRVIASLALSLGLAAGIVSSNTKQVDASTIESESIYVVQSGDCLWTIAQRFNMTLRQLEALNGLNDYSIIYPDDRLKLVGDATVVSYSDNETASVTYEDPATPDYSQQQQQVQEQAPQAPANNYQSQASSQTVSGSEASAKAWIAQRESGGSYTIVNPSSGTYGRYQLTPDKLKGDYSPANQERVADNYVRQKYGSWSQAKAFWLANGWY